MRALLALPLHAVLMLGAALLLPGLLEAGAAWLAGRPAPAPLQGLRDLARLARRVPSRAEAAAPVMALLPAASLVAALAAALLVPSFALFMPTWPLDDALLVAGLLAASRACLLLAALDGEGALAGLGATRAAGRTAMARPALLLALLVLAAEAGSTNVDAIAGGPGVAGQRAPLLLALAATAAAWLAGEAGEAHGRPELTGATGIAARNLAGRDLACVRAAAGLRLVTGITLAGTLFAPLGMAAALGSAAWPVDWLGGIAGWAVRLALGGLVLCVARGLRPPVATRALLGGATLLGLLGAMLLLQSLA